MLFAGKYYFFLISLHTFLIKQESMSLPGLRGLEKEMNKGGDPGTPAYAEGRQVREYSLHRGDPGTGP